MGIFTIVIMIFVVGFGIWYIHLINKMHKLEMIARDAGSDIDGLIWDRNHQLSEMLKIIDAKKINCNIVREKKNMLTIGMLPEIQEIVVRELDEKAKEIYAVMKENDVLMTDDDFQKHFKKFEQARLDIITSVLSYNNKAGMYNSYIAGYVTEFLARHKGMKRKAFFNYIFNEIKEDE